jgi:hypothetical protein
VPYVLYWLKRSAEPLNDVKPVDDLTLRVYLCAPGDYICGAPKTQTGSRLRSSVTASQWRSRWEGSVMSKVERKRSETATVKTIRGCRSAAQKITDAGVGSASAYITLPRLTTSKMAEHV